MSVDENAVFRCIQISVDVALKVNDVQDLMLTHHSYKHLKRVRSQVVGLV